MSIDYLISGSLGVMLIGSLIAVKVNLKDKISHKEAESKFVETKLCNEIHKSVDQKLSCLPEVKDTLARLETKVDILLNGNGK
jgi:hypothetical protein